METVQKLVERNEQPNRKKKKKKKVGHQSNSQNELNRNKPMKNLRIHQYERGEQSEITVPLYIRLANINPWLAAGSENAVTPDARNEINYISC